MGQALAPSDRAAALEIAKPPEHTARDLAGAVDRARPPRSSRPRAPSRTAPEEDGGSLRWPRGLSPLYLAVGDCPPVDAPGFVEDPFSSDARQSLSATTAYDVARTGISSYQRSDVLFQ